MMIWVVNKRQPINAFTQDERSDCLLQMPKMAKFS